MAVLFTGHAVINLFSNGLSYLSMVYPLYQWSTYQSMVYPKYYDLSYLSCISMVYCYHYETSSDALDIFLLVAADDFLDFPLEFFVGVVLDGRVLLQSASLVALPSLQPAPAGGSLEHLPAGLEADHEGTA